MQELCYLVDNKGFYGEFGGAYVPEILYATVKNLQEQYLPIIESQEFRTSIWRCCATTWGGRRRSTWPAA